ncbi:MAG TPA: TIGR03936 family radical SAM-associated protein, partial [Thermodesulfobacteriota bacterium]|nr:TIGR03936 family radical SAM-associated protein [Thermodesulfobacteriota bacterium]
CLAGMVCRPVRERTLKTISELVSQSLKATGYEEISLTSLSSGDYSDITVLVKGLMERLNEEKVALSLPSLRVETLTPDLMEEIKRVRKTGFTIAPEAGTQRLRDVINKGITEEQILSTVEAVFKGGWKGIKLYFMVGLPTETEDDRMGILELCRKIKEVARKISHSQGINVNISTFVPKPHTPFQWEAQIPFHDMIEIIRFLTRELKKMGLNPKWQEPEMSLLEGVFARGDRRLSKVIINAQKIGCRFDGWRETFRFDLWEKAFEENQIEMGFYTSRPRSLEENLPWSHLDPQIDRDFLKRERERAMKAVLTPDCRSAGSCQGCGACPDRMPVKMSNVIRRGGQMTKCGVCPAINYSYAPSPLKEKRFHCRFFKLNEARLLSHLETITVFSRTLRRAGIPIKYSEGFHPLPRIISGSALPVGIESICESIDFVVSGDMSPSTFLKKMNRELPSGLKFLEAEEVPLKFSPVSDTIHNVNYLISLASYDSSSVRLLEQFKGAPELKGKGVGEGEKPLSALEIGVLDSTFLSVRMEERMGLSKTLQGFFHIDPNGLRGMRVLKTQFIKGN